MVQAKFAAGDTVQAKFAETSRTWKRATVIEVDSGDGYVIVQFEGYEDQHPVPTERVRVPKDPAAKRGRPKAGPKTKPQLYKPGPARHVAAPTTASEKAVCEMRALLSKLTPDNFDRIRSCVVQIQIDGPATLTALFDLLFERAVIESFFCDIYARLFVRIAEALPAFENPDTRKRDTFLSLLLGRVQTEIEKLQGHRGRCVRDTAQLGDAAAPDDEIAFQDYEIALPDEVIAVIAGCIDPRPTHGVQTLLAMSSVSTQWRRVVRPLPSVVNRLKLDFLAFVARSGFLVFLGELWLKGLLPEKILHGCAAGLLNAAHSDGAGPLQTDAIEAVCKLLSTIGKPCDADVARKQRMDAYIAPLKHWATDNVRLPSARLRFKLMDVLDARSGGWP